jgi:hypothetical protein
MKAIETLDPRVLEILDAEWTKKNDVAYRTAWKYSRKMFTNDGGRAMWLTGSTGDAALEDIVQLTICHAWTLFVNLSIQEPEETTRRRVTAAVFTALKRVCREGRQYREAGRMATTGHVDVLNGSSMTRTTYESHDGGSSRPLQYSVPELTRSAIPWGIEYAPEQAYRVPENREALDRILKRITSANCAGHDTSDCRTYRKIIRLMADKNGDRAKVADAVGMTKATFRRRLFHVADALRQAMAVDELTLPREAVADPVHVTGRCRQLDHVPAGPVDHLAGPTSDATGGCHDWTRPGADRGTGREGRDWVTA